MKESSSSGCFCVAIKSWEGILFPREKLVGIQIFIDYYFIKLKEDPILYQTNPILNCGRRKSAIAQIKLVSGIGEFTINGQRAAEYMQGDSLSIDIIEAPIKAVKLQKRCDIIVKVKGGGLKGQAQAIRLGIARALCDYESSYRTSLKEKGYLTRDSRIKERRKYGLKKARKAPQYSKR